MNSSTPKDKSRFSMETRSAFQFSASLHLIFFVSLFAVPWLLSLRQPPPELFFELVSLPPEGEEVARDPVDPEPEPLHRPLEVPELEALRDIPEVDLERLRPAPEPEPQPSPVAQPEPEPPQRIRYDEWRQGRDLPNARPAPAPAPRRTPSPVPEVSTRVRERLQSALSEIRYDRSNLSASVTADEMAAYISALSSRLQGAFEPVGQGLEAEVSFQVSGTGRFSDIRILRSSGNSAFDEAVRRTFQRTQPPGNPPGNRPYTFTLTFRSIEG